MTSPPTPTVAQKEIADSASRSAIDVGYETLYIHTGIEGYDPNQQGVTDANNQLVHPKFAFDALLLDLWQKARFTIDWNEELQRLAELRLRSAHKDIFNRAVDGDWDVTELLVFRSTTSREIGPILSIASDEISWAMEEAQQPYRRAFQSLTAGLQSCQNISQQASGIASYSDVGHDLQSWGMSMHDLYSSVQDGMNLSQAWQQAISALLSNDETTFTTAPLTVLNASEGILLGRTVSIPVSEVVDTVTAKIKIYALAYAYCHIRIPVVRNIASLDKKFHEETAVPAEVALYQQYLQQNYQMNALYLLTISEYWDRISEEFLEPMSEILTGATEHAGQTQEWGERAQSMVKQTGKIYGAGLSDVLTQLEQSPNASAHESPNDGWEQLLQGDG